MTSLRLLAGRQHSPDRPFCSFLLSRYFYPGLYLSDSRLPVVWVNVTRSFACSSYRIHWREEEKKKKKNEISFFRASHWQMALRFQSFPMTKCGFHVTDRRYSENIISLKPAAKGENVITCGRESQRLKISDFIKIVSRTLLQTISVLESNL